MSKKKTDKTIPVLDSGRCFLSNTTPAKARMLLKSGKVSVFQQNPFILIMNGDLGDDNMVKKVMAKNRMFISNFTSYFSDEKEVYIQNLGSTNISLTIQTMGDPIYISIARTKKPMNLTQYAPFELIKNSADFRKLINRNPPILRLMTEEEYVEYYEKMAEEEKIDLESAMRKGQDAHDVLMGKKRLPVNELQVEMDKKLEEKEEKLLQRKEPHQRVVGLCALADKDNGPDQRVTAADMKEELESLESILTAEDWEFVASKGVYKTVKDFAFKKLEELTASESDEE